MDQYIILIQYIIIHQT